MAHDGDPSDEFGSATEIPRPFGAAARGVGT